MQFCRSQTLQKMGWVGKLNFVLSQFVIHSDPGYKWMFMEINIWKRPCLVCFPDCQEPNFWGWLGKYCLFKYEFFFLSHLFFLHGMSCFSEYLIENWKLSWCVASSGPLSFCFLVSIQFPCQAWKELKAVSVVQYHPSFVHSENKEMKSKSE